MRDQQHVNRTLQTYLLKLDNWIDAATCQRALATIESARWKPHSYSGVSGSMQEPASLSGEQELDVAYANDPVLAQTMMQKMVSATRFYSVRLQFPWLAAPKQHSEVRYNRYGPGQLMLEHCDHIHTLFGEHDGGIPILSCLTLLNADYTGGDFVLWGDEVIPMQAGTTIVFPSNFLFPHRVEPVLSGLRYSCISWAW